MNDDELRKALRPPDGIEPLDPAKVIAGAQRRRKRGLAAGSAAAVAVLAVVAGSVIATNGTNGSPEVGPVGPPNSPRTAPSSPATPPDSPLSPPTNTPPNTPGSTPGSTAGSSVVDVALAEIAACKSAIKGETPRPGASASVQAAASAPDGTTFVVAEGKYWAACDTGYGQDGAKEMSARRPGADDRPAAGDRAAFAVAENRVTKDGEAYDYYWAAGVMPAGAKAITYTFPDGSAEDAVVEGKYWLMHHWTPSRGATPAPDKIRVRVTGANDAVLGDLRLDPGVHTCAQITHGC